MRTCLLHRILLAGLMLILGRVDLCADEPRTAADWFKLGREYYDADREADAVACFNAALAKAPGDVDSLCWRGRSYVNLGRPEQASRDFAAALKLNPNHAETHLGLAWLSIQRKDVTRAIAEVTAAIEAAPQTARYRYSRANMRHRFVLDARTSDIRKDYDEAIRLDPDYALAYMARGGLKWETGDPQGSIADQTKAIELEQGKNAIPYGNRAMAYYALGQNEKAQADFNKAFEVDPQCRKYFAEQVQTWDRWVARREQLRKSSDAPKEGLSFDRLCAYCHGWTYNRSGSCVSCGKYGRGTD